MADDLGSFFAPPPFKPDEAWQRLRRDARDMGLTERNGQFEWRHQPVLRGRVEGTLLRLERAASSSPGRTPAWQSVDVDSHAKLRDLRDALKRWVTGERDADER